MNKIELRKEGGQEVIDSIHNELKVLSELCDHPHVATLYEIIETKKFLYIIMDYASGGELFDYIVAHGHVEEHVACRFFHEMISALDFCHKKGIVHRDIKPENLLFDANMSVILIDYGLAERYDPKGITGAKRLEGLEHGGSPSYLAPEIIVDHEEINIGPPVDVWAMGVVLYALVCGALPFSGSTAADGSEDLQSLFDAIVTGEFAVAPFISEEVKDLIHGMLRTHPDERFT